MNLLRRRLTPCPSIGWGGGGRVPSYWLLVNKCDMSKMIDSYHNVKFIVDGIDHETTPLSI